MIVIDAHLDLAWNALGWNRDLTLDLPEIRGSEVGMQQPGRGTNVVSFSEMRKGDVAVSSATVLARAGNLREPGLDFRSRQMAYAVAQGQLAFYRMMEADGHLRMLKDLKCLESHLHAWQSNKADVPLGYILSMEGADPIVSPGQVGSWWDDGLRITSLVHYGKNSYAHGTGCPGPLTDEGRDLLRAMDEVGMILDVTHLADESFWQAVEIFNGHIIASHHNCRSLVPGDRQLTDDQIRYLIGRGGVIAAAFDAWMLYPGWVRGKTVNSVLTMEAVADHMDHICQIAGNAHHIAIGSDLDGGFGAEQCPSDLDSIADLQKLQKVLRRRGYTDEDVRAVMHGNLLRAFRAAWANN
ncbi:MAG: dipeptidase [Terriglobales bacterium]